MANEEERNNFFSLTLLLFRVGNQKLREYFKSQWPIVYQRVKPGTVPPAWQDTPNDATEMKKIQPTKLKFKFKDEETKFNSGNTNDWDLSLLTSVLIYSSLGFVKRPSPECKALEDIKTIRNTLIGHAADAGIPNAVFNTQWKKACNALTLFKATAADFKSVEDDVKKPLDVLFPMLKQYVEQTKEIQDAFNTGIRKIEQLKQETKESHSALQRGQYVIIWMLSIFFLVVAVLALLVGCIVHVQNKEEPETLKNLMTTTNGVFVAIAAIWALGLLYLMHRAYTYLAHLYYMRSCSKRLKSSIIKQTEWQKKSMTSHDVHSAKTDDIFVNLKVYQDSKQVKQEKERGLNRSELLQEYPKRTATSVKKCKDIFIDVERKNPKRLLLTGKPGIGKSLFCQKLIRDWACEKLFENEENGKNPDIQFAYLLTFRQLSLLGDNKINLRELLNLSNLLDDHSIIDDSLFEYLIKNPSKVLVIFDGYDEYSKQHREEIAGDSDQEYQNNTREKMSIPALCSKLIKGKILTDCVVMICSRPGEAENLGEINFDRYVEIAGFSRKQVIKCIEKYFSKTKSKEIIYSLVEHIKGNDNLISFCHIPLMCFLLCHCLEWHISFLKNLPSTTTGLYAEVFEVFVLKLHSNLKNLKKCTKNTEIMLRNAQHALALLAGNLLKEMKYIFDEEDMKELNLSEDEIESLKVSGILNCVPGIRISAFKTKAEYSFTHLTLQEYLAAVLFVENDEIPKKENTSGQTYVFMSGLMSKKKDIKCLSHMKKMMENIKPQDCNDTKNKLLTLECLREYEDDELAKLEITEILDKYCNSHGRIEFGRLTGADGLLMQYFFYIVSLLKKEEISLPVTSLVIQYSPLTPSIVQALCKSLATTLSRVSELWICDCKLDDKCVDIICRSLSNTYVTRLYLPRNDITDKGVESICNLLKNNKCCIEWLNLRDNDKITDECKEGLSNHWEKLQKTGMLGI